MQNEGWGTPPQAEAVAAPAETQEAFIARRNMEIQNWLNAKETAVNAVQNERDFRAKVTQMLFPNPARGTQRYELNGGYKIKLVYALRYTLGNKDLVDPATNEKVPVKAQVEALEQAIAELGNEGGLLAERLIKWEPKLVDSEYRKLNTEFETEAKAKQLIDAILTITPATPTLEFEEPKSK